MARRFDAGIERAEQATRDLQWSAALGAGVLAGAVLLVVPRGSPWSSFTVFNPTIMGRGLPPGFDLPLPAVWALHLSLALVYGLVISIFAARLSWHLSVLVGGCLGLLLYALNTAVVAFFWPEWRNPAFPVIFAHLVFGLLAGGAYRGLLRRRRARADLS